MISRPKYFETVQRKAAQRWDRLELDQEDAGVWRQLLEQVQQHPQHVVSELLQNADDAGATMASVEIKDRDFVFTHDGKDFTESDFGSLCQFTGSNKHHMNTTGFRGIGFKSTFSLGEEVHLITPTLSVIFREKRFTEPIWFDHHGPIPSRTEVRVRIKNKQVQQAMQKNLDDWMENPTSLLFFRSIRSLRINDKDVRWIFHGRGPVDDSKWWKSSESPDKYLVLRSPAEPFPPDAEDEIRKARSLGTDALPRCQVELVLGPDLRGRLFVILPTGVTTPLPFACNAPFIQDPARIGIKNPAASRTNHWLLERAGQLAGSAMLAWLNRENISVKERCKAYSLFPNFDPDDNSDVEDGDRERSPLEMSCAEAIQKAFDEAINEKQFLITEKATLQLSGGCVAVPPPLVEVWSDSQISELLGEDKKPILSRHVRVEDVQKLILRECVSGLGESDILWTLKRGNVPKPKTPLQLLNLWDYLKTDLLEAPDSHDDVRIFPVQGKDSLYAANDVVHVAEKKVLRLSKEDLEFLAAYAPVLDQKWLRFLQRRKAEKDGDKLLLKRVKAASAILIALGCGDTSEISELIEKASEHFFEPEVCILKDCVRLAHIAAVLGAPVPDSFHFVTRDGIPTEATHGILADVGKHIADFADNDWWHAHVLHQDYSRGFTSCTESEWQTWIASEGSRLITFVPLDETTTEKRCQDTTEIEELLKERGVEKQPSYPYPEANFKHRKYQFLITDWDFEDTLWEHWHSIALKDDAFWSRLLAQIVAQTHRFWSEALSCKIVQVAANGSSSKPIMNETICSAWIAKLRKLACVEDTSGKLDVPSLILRGTAQNESLRSVERFIRMDFDTEGNRPLLDALRVGTKAAGADGILARLRICAAGQNPSIDEVFALYHGLDQILASHSMKDRQHVHDIFVKEALILTAENKWEFLSAVYLGSNEVEVPGAAVVHSAVRHLTMWTKIGVTLHPTVELVLEGLKRLESGQCLSANELRSAQSFLPQHPERIWSECGHWLNLEGEWTTVKSLKYALVGDSCRWDNLYSQVKQQTADFRMLRPESLQNRPFSEVPNLAACLEDRPAKLPKPPRTPEKKSWLAALGSGFQRVQLANQEDADRIHSLGKRLAETAWQAVPEIEIVPFIDGQRAGDPRPAEAFWNDAVLYVANRAVAKMPKPIAGLLGRGFGTDILDAINYCYDRERDKVLVYLEANFSLASAEESKPAASDRGKVEDSGGESLESSITGDSVPTTVADAIQSLLDTDATSPTPIPGELDRPDRLTSSRPGSRTGARSTSPSPRDDDDGDERDDSGDGETHSSEPGRRGERRGYAVLRSYVVPDRPEDSSPTDDEGQTHRTETGQAGVNRVLEYERSKGRTPREMLPNHPGYDVESSNGSVDIERYIEVKSLSGDWRGPDAGMTPKQFEKAAKEGDLYWLYIVERAQQVDFRIHRIQDPTGKVNRFMFDPKWEKVAEEANDEDTAENGNA